MKEIVKKLIELNKTISTMESCTGGYLANCITNIEGASSVLKFSAITYSNEYKIKMGVDKDKIDKYTVYSKEVAKEMSKKISEFSNSDYGIGITGKINAVDPNNLTGFDDLVFVSLYEKEKDAYNVIEIKTIKDTRENNKKMIVEKIINLLSNII